MCCAKTSELCIISQDMTVKAFIKKEAVFCCAFAAAAVSAFFIHPDSEYAGYIDTHVLFILYSLMLVVAGLRSCGVFDSCAAFLCRKMNTLRSLSTVLVFLCFIFSMFITNDVSLITFVPFAVLLLERCGKIKYAPYVIVLQTVAANLGSMLTPMGNPQNLFLYTRMKISAFDFALILLHFAAVSAVMLLLSLLFIPAEKIEQIHEETNSMDDVKKSPAALSVFIILFALCLCCVFRMVPAWITASVCFVSVLIIRRRLLLKADYMLLLTFCAFFIFTGNIARIPPVRNMLEKAVQGHEFYTALAASQIISNVPAALLLFPFSSDLKELLLGVDIGGLGTLVASLASLISYKLYVNADIKNSSEKISGLKYLALFTVVNTVFLIVLCVMREVMRFIKI